MKRFNAFTLTIASLVFAITVMSGGVASAVPVITNGLVAAYEVDGDADDVSGNGNNGGVLGATLTADRFGNLDSAYSFSQLAARVEINPVFLHARQLFILTHEPKTSSRYKANALLNIGTFVTFRILLLGWMTRHGYIFFLKVPRHFASIFSFF